MNTALLWEITKKNNSFLMKGDGRTYSKDPMNLTGKNCIKYSGLVNTKAINVTVKDNKVILLTNKKNTDNKPSKTILKTQFKNGKRRTLSGIRNTMRAQKYRPELEMIVLRKASALMNDNTKKVSKK